VAIGSGGAGWIFGLEEKTGSWASIIATPATKRPVHCHLGLAKGDRGQTPVVTGYFENFGADS
jgi:hypothetical protein